MVFIWKFIGALLAGGCASMSQALHPGTRGISGEEFVYPCVGGIIGDNIGGVLTFVWQFGQHV